MRYFFSTFVLALLFHLSVMAQEKRFIFIQNEARQPFYVSVNGKIFSSTITGYVIIPKLTEGNYTVAVGFADKNIPEQPFQLQVENKDLGFSLKNFGEKGYGLFNLQSLAVLMSSPSDIAKSSSVAKQAPANDQLTFTATKAKATEAPKEKEAISKPTVKEDQVVKAEKASKAETVTTPNVPVDIKQIVENKNSTDPVVQAKAEKQVAAAPQKKDQISKKNEASGLAKIAESKENEGVYLTYIDKSGKRSDTINIIIPTDEVVTTAPLKKEYQERQVKKEEAVQTGVVKTTKASPRKKKIIEPELSNEESAKGTKEVAKNDDPVFLNIVVSGSDVAKLKESLSKEEEVRVLLNSSSNCKNLASEDDYIKVRRRMANETTDEKMINEARKFYKNRCFTTEQIKRLSTLFLSDEGRYRFFDASYSAIADTDNYAALEKEFVDPTYTNRFRALISLQ